MHFAFDSKPKRHWQRWVGWMVVVAIIAVLIAILLPTMQRAL